jgi:hypothetical protein
MATLESRMIIPEREKELIDANAGDAIKISYPGDRDNMKSIWTILFNESNNIYTFIAQEKSRCFGEESRIRQYIAHLSRIQFDDKLGATLNNLGYNLCFLNQKAGKTYENMVNVLKEAKSWEEDKFYALYDEKGENLLGFVTNDTFTAMGRISCRNFKTKLIPLEQAKEIRNAYEKGLK